SLNIFYPVWVYFFTLCCISIVNSPQTYKVFDDTDLTGDDQFAFVEPQKIYDCKIGILGDIDPSGESFDVIGEEHIGKMNLFKLSNAYGDYWECKIFCVN
ncbi:hypothetical protein HCY81_09990, partial [Limosilactobacillus fermentum]